MASRSNRRIATFFALVVLALVAVGCAQSSDPTTWEEALAEGNVEQNFLNACVEADDGATSDEQALNRYCECSFDELQETFADDFGRFDSVDDALRADPEAIDDPTLVSDERTRADVRAAAEVVQGCASQHLG